MKITSSYSAEIKRKGLPLRQTIQIYREAVCFLSEVFFSEWGGLSQIADATFYNIGARYFIRELQKPLSETARSSLEAKVPAVKRRSSCVYADLIHMSRELGIRKDA